MSPTLRTSALAALAAGLALVGGPWVVATALGVLLAGTTLDARFASRSPQVRRTAPTTLARGVPGVLRIAVDAPSAGSVRVRQPMPADLCADPASAADGLDAVLTASRRGVHELGQVVVATTGPLGLARSTRSVGEAAIVRVYPDLPAAERIAHAVRTGRFGADGRRRRGALGLGTDLETVRDWQPDDDIRQVNWAATQRCGRPMSNQYRRDQDRDVILLVDHGRLMASPVDGGTRLDAALDAVAALAAVADVIGDRCGVLAFADRPGPALPPRRAGGRAVVDALFDLEPTNTDSDYASAFAEVAAAKRSLIVVFSDLVEPVATRPLLAAVPVLARRHAVVVAGVAEPDYDAILTAAPATARDVHRAAVVAELLEQRRSVVAEIAALGVRVVDTPPSGLAAASVGAYLRLKERARI